MDSTIDISHTDQFSFYLRYVDETFTIQERFILFTDIKKSDAATLFDTLTGILQDLNLNINRIRSQSYDGAANMRGHVSGLQTRVKRVNKHALFVHCCAHNLNLVLSDACSDCTEATTFFGCIQKLHNFFTSSQPRLLYLENALKDLNLKDRKLQSLSETRWYCRYEAVKVVKELYPALLTALENIVLKDKSTDTKAEAKGIVDYLSKLECLVMLQIWTHILSEVQSLSEYLQNETMDLVTVSSKIESVAESLKKHRSDETFKDMLRKALEIATAEDVSTEFQCRRVPNARECQVNRPQMSQLEILLINLEWQCFTKYMIHLLESCNHVLKIFRPQSFPSNAWCLVI